MSETYSHGLLWMLCWPAIIYVTYRFALLNLREYARREQLENAAAPESDLQFDERSLPPRQARSSRGSQ